MGVLIAQKKDEKSWDLCEMIQQLNTVFLLLYSCKTDYLRLLKT